MPACWHIVLACWHIVPACWHIVHGCWHRLSNECHRHVGNVVHVKFDTDHPPYKASGNVDNPSNYRPISLLSVVSKIMERHIYSIVFEHLADREFLSAAHGGFALGNPLLCQPFTTSSNSWKMALMSPLSFLTCVKHSTVFPIFLSCIS